MAEDNQNINGAYPGKYNQNDSEGIQFEVSEDSQLIFDPNEALSGLENYLALNNVVNKLIGVDTNWFRAIPQQRSKDVMFKEYTLYNVEDEPHCIKVVLPDGRFPDSKYSYDLMGLEYEVPLEVHIDKSYWDEKVGYGTAPQKKDIVYIPIANKLYQIESAYLFRGFMEQETHWILNLRKYQTEASRSEGENLKETIDKYTVSEEELFGEEQQKEYDKLVNDQQFSQFNSTSEDKYKELNPDLQVLSDNITFFGVLASETFYNLFTSSKPDAIKYNISDYIPEDKDRGFTCLVNIQENTNKEYDVSWIKYDDNLAPPSNYKIKISSREKFSIGDILNVYRSEKLNFYVEIIDNSNANSGVYYCRIPKKIENYLNTIKTNWVNLSNFKAKVDNPTNLLTGVNKSNKGLNISMISNKYLRIYYGNDEYIFITTNKVNYNTWYGISVNIGNTWQQLNAHIWKHGTSANDKLTTFYSDTIQFKPSELYIDYYKVNKSNTFLTNIRLFAITIEEEYQVKELLSYFTENADYGIILDNSDNKFAAPYISQQR